MTKSGFDLRPKPPPSSSDVDRDLLGRHAERLGQLGRVPPRALHRRPDLARAVGRDARGGRRRLHRRVREVRHVVLGRRPLGRRRERRVDVAVVAHDLAGLARGRLQLRLVGLPSRSWRSARRPT